MMNIKNDSGTSAFIIMITTLLAFPSITLHNLFTEVLISRGVPYSIFATSPIPMFWAGFYPVLILGLCFAFIPCNLTLFTFYPSFLKFDIRLKSIIYMIPVTIGFMPRLISHPFYRRMIALLHTFVPSFRNMGRCVRVMTSYIFRDIKRSSTLSFNFNVIGGVLFYRWRIVKGKWIERFATTTSALSSNFYSLCF